MSDATRAASEDPRYALSSSSPDEHERLRKQSGWYVEFTRRLLERAGVRPGMRVLDAGSGPGDVSFLAAELVGSGGSVVGVERDEEALRTAQRRALESELDNVEFVLGDFRDFEPTGKPFDALVGRLVLMYQSDPVVAVRAAARHVRPGGVVVFAEMSLTLDSAPEQSLVSYPLTPAFRQLSGWIHAMHTAMGTKTDMGMRLLATFAEAGLEPEPQLEGDVVIGVGEEAIRRTVEVTRSFLPGLIATGAATEEEIDIDTLADRLRADTGPVGRVVFWPTLVGGFATKPA